MAGARDSCHTDNRLLGFQEALFEHNIPYNPHLTRYGDWERDRGYDNAAELLSEGVTAIFAHNDLMAIGVIDYCNQKGIEVGKDLALIGFDDREIASVCRPTLSTVALPLFDIGHTAADVMLDMIEKDIQPATREILLGCNIVERESTGFTL
jgi:LacI family transcriptional regulator